MKWTAWIAIASALTLAGCQTSAGNCAGWRQPPKANDPASLVQREETIARYLVATDRFGKAQGCWK